MFILLVRKAPDYTNIQPICLNSAYKDSMKYLLNAC